MPLLLLIDAIRWLRLLRLRWFFYASILILMSRRCLFGHAADAAVYFASLFDWCWFSSSSMLPPLPITPPPHAISTDRLCFRHFDWLLISPLIDYCSRHASRRFISSIRRFSLDILMFRLMPLPPRHWLMLRATLRRRCRLLPPMMPLH